MMNNDAVHLLKQEPSTAPLIALNYYVCRTCRAVIFRSEYLS